MSPVYQLTRSCFHQGAVDWVRRQFMTNYEYPTASDLSPYVGLCQARNSSLDA